MAQNKHKRKRSDGAKINKKGRVLMAKKHKRGRVLMAQNEHKRKSSDGAKINKKGRVLMAKKTQERMSNDGANHTREEEF